MKSNNLKRCNFYDRAIAIRADDHDPPRLFIYANTVKVIFLNNLKEVVVKNFTFVVKEVDSSNQLICKWTKRVNFLSEDSFFKGPDFFTFRSEVL